jgi:TRAP-type mannitol/chloroaromatic compound transport system substrate-binding protein
MIHKNIVGAVILASMVIATSVTAGWFSSSDADTSSATKLKTYDLTMVTAFPKNSPGHGASSKRFADRLRTISNGRINIKVYSAHELVPAFESFSAVSNGKADVYHGIEMFWPGVDPALNYFATIPFGLTPEEHVSWIKHGGGQELWDEVANQYNIKPFAAGSSGFSMGGWFKKEINTTKDLDGLHLRWPGLSAKVMQEYGATTTVVSGSKILPGLLDGTFDGAELAGPWYDNAMGLYKSGAMNYYAPGWHEPGVILSMGFNKDVWDQFTDTDKEIVKAAIDAELLVQYTENFFNHSTSLEKMYSENNVVVKHFNKELLKDFKTTAYRLLKERDANSKLAGKVRESYFDFLEKGTLFNKNSVQPYLELRDIDVE